MDADAVVLCAAPYAAAPEWLAPGFEAALAEEIAASLAASPGALRVHACPTAGPGLVFAEAALARGAELHLLLPGPPEKFLDWQESLSSPAHRARIEVACARAARVEPSSEDRLAGDETQLRFNNLMLQGLARLEADRLARPARLVAAWSPAAPAEPGSPADFIDQWPEIERLTLIDLDEPRGAAEGEGRGPLADIAPDRDALAIVASPLAIRAIFFADLATYSTLPDEEVPLLWDFLSEAQLAVEACATPPILINTWGDAVHAAAETATDLAGYAAALVEAVATLPFARFGLRARPRFRVALHAGPVYVGLHPLTGRSMVFGHHVNRAARIEAIATPGEIHVSQPFAALLRAEMDARLHEARAMGQDRPVDYALSLVGTMDLPKNFGRETIWRLTRPGPEPA